MPARVFVIVLMPAEDAPGYRFIAGRRPSGDNSDRATTLRFRVRVPLADDSQSYTSGSRIRPRTHRLPGFAPEFTLGDLTLRVH